MSYSSAYSPYTGRDFDWDDEEPCGRLLTQSEYTLRLRNRSDIFTIKKNTFLSKAEAFCLSVAFIIGLWLPSVEIMTISCGPGSFGCNLKKHTPVKRGLLIQTGSGITTGGRSRSSIARVVQQNMSALRYAYNRRLREKPGLNGKIRVRFAIDEFGKVIFCDVIGSTMGDDTFKKLIAAKIKLWVFEKIDKPGDVTEVIYPFVFSI